MAKKKTASKPAKGDGQTLQSVCDGILDAAYSDGKRILTGKELFEEVKKVMPSAKEGSSGQALNKWKKKNNLIKGRGARTVTKPKPSKPSRPVSVGNGLLDRVQELSKIIPIPDDKLADVVRVLSR